MKLRPLGKIMLDMEKLLEELTDPNGHDCQWYEVLNLVHGWLGTHATHAQEEYLDNSRPTFYYGPEKDSK